MKHQLIVFLASITLITASTAALAQSTAATAPITPKSSKGDFALLFDLGGLADLALNGFYGPGGDTSELGAGFGAKYFVVDDVALRLGVTLQSLSTDRPVGSDTSEFSDKFTVFRFALAPSVTVNLVKSASVAGYVGGQVSYGVSNATTTPADTTQRTVDATTTSLGVGAIIGAEWFPWPNISFSGEYILAFARSTSEELRGTNNPIRFELPTETAIGVHSRGVLTAAMYW